MKTIRITLAMTGITAIAYAIVGIATDPGARPVGQLAFLATVLLGHDVIVLPLAIAIGAIVARWAPAWIRGPLYGGLFATTIVTLIALPFLIGAGRSADNPSALPLNYGRGLTIVLAAIWLFAAMATARRILIRRKTSHDR